MKSMPDVNWKTASFKQLKGSLMVQTQYNDRNLEDDFSYVRLALNYDAELQVCRYQDEDANGAFELRA